MADVVNTRQGPLLFPDGTIRGRYYIRPVYSEYVSASFGTPMRGPDREYYERNPLTGEWDFDRREAWTPPPPVEPYHELIKGV